MARGAELAWGTLLIFFVFLLFKSEYDATAAVSLSCSTLRWRRRDRRKVGVDFDVGQVISKPSNSGSSNQLTIVEFNTLQVMTRNQMVERGVGNER